VLSHLHINDFTLVDTLDQELHGGLTVLTGETGAGKSILLDALSLTLGDRADADKVRMGCDRADIHASFDISHVPYAQRWLMEHDLGEESECILRRVVTAEGRSRAYINGKTVTLQQLKTLGEMLIDIHSQHEHQSLLKTSTHRRLLDAFANADELAKQVRNAHKKWQDAQQALEETKANTEEINARFQLLRYQVEELDQLDLQPGELAELEEKQRSLANAEQIMQNCRGVMDICTEAEDSISDRLHKALQLLDRLPVQAAATGDAASMLRDALIQVEEAQRELDRHLDSFDSDDAGLVNIEERLSAVYDIARKHRIQPEELAELHQKLAEELSGLKSGDEQLETLEAEAQQALARYTEIAQQLTKQRQQAAKKLATQVNQQLHELAMERAKLQVELKKADSPTKHGNESVEFLISTNPGQPAKPLIKIASGGELSRVSLAIQVVTAQTSTIPTLIFDEVDVGIGGTTGDVVGRLLRELGQRGQVLCVTHLPQVASKAHHHLRVEKKVDKKSAQTQLKALEGEDKVTEIARMMGGDTDSAQSLAHAREMVEGAASFKLQASS
jgi:DNA repair protein RecN (Recombination protein N)